MTMSDVSDVVVGVEIAPPFIVIEILHLAAHDVERLFVRDAQIASEQLPSCFQNGVSLCHARKSVISSKRARFAAIDRWLICKYSFSGRCFCWYAARQTLMQRRLNTSGHNASNSFSVSANSLV